MLLLSLPLFGQEKKDILVMKNGDRFKGEIKGLAPACLQWIWITLTEHYLCSGPR